MGESKVRGAGIQLSFMLALLPCLWSCAYEPWDGQGPEPRAPDPVVEPGYWSPALERRREVLLEGGYGSVHPGNAEVYTRAIAMACQEAAEDLAEVELLQKVVLIRLPGELAFASGSARLSGDAERVLGRLAGVFQDYALSMLEISGHTDNTGSARSNEALSLLRAAAVAEFLEQRGVFPGRFVSEGRGDSRPIGDNATPEGRRQNRRVELRVVPLLPTRQHRRPDGIRGEQTPGS
jgi:outer membrane protein OmpA-like peptidoglycan-associated protein